MITKHQKLDNIRYIQLGRQVTAVVRLSRKELDKLEELPRQTHVKEPRLARKDMSSTQTQSHQRKQIRPSSASANLQSHVAFSSGLFNNRRPTTAVAVERPKTGVPKAHHWRGGSETAELDRIKLQRRPTLSTVEGLEETDVPRAGTANASAGDLLKSKVKFHEFYWNDI